MHLPCITAIRRESRQNVGKSAKLRNPPLTWSSQLTRGLASCGNPKHFRLEDDSAPSIQSHRSRSRRHNPTGCGNSADRSPGRRRHRRSRRPGHRVGGHPDRALHSRRVAAPAPRPERHPDGPCPRSLDPGLVLATPVRHSGLAGLGLLRVLGRHQPRPPAPRPPTRSPLPPRRLECDGGPRRRRPDPRSAPWCSHGYQFGAYWTSGQRGPGGAASFPDQLGGRLLAAHRSTLGHSISRATGHRHPHSRARRHAVEHRRPVLRRRRAVAGHLPGECGPVPAGRWRPH
jgi:hypothetical protein